MQNKILSVLVAATLVTCGARAQDATIATPTSPAPATQQPAAVATPQAMPAPNQIIYAPRLPSANELTSAAAAQGLSVEQINQTSNQITVVYRNSNGQTNTVSYQLLPTGAPTTTTTTTVIAPNPAPTVVYQTPPTVVYETSPSVVYYDTYRPYYRPYYYPPVSLSFGFGYYHGGHGWGGHGGGWGHGGWHH